MDMNEINLADFPQTASVRVPGAVLVIDDNTAMLAALTDVLALLTEAAVYTATNGPEGLKILQQREDIALVVLDMNMPLMSGEEIYEKLQQLAPDVKVIVSSSLNPAEARTRFGKRELPPFLQKPYDVTTLLTVVQSVATGTGASLPQERRIPKQK